MVAEATNLCCRIVILRMMLLLFLDDINSERALMRIIRRLTALLIPSPELALR
jgi:hypothetical protein